MACHSFFNQEFFAESINDNDFNAALDCLIESAQSFERAWLFYALEIKNNNYRKEYFEELANRRHKENRAMKQDAIKYYLDNHTTFKNKDEAALFISGKVVLAEFSTVRGWLKGITHE